MEDLKKYPFYPELTDEGKQQAQDLMIKFEKTLKESATKIISDFTTDFYCEVLHEIESYHWTNYRTKIVSAICDYSNKKSMRYFFPKAKYASSKFFLVAPANLWPNSKKGYLNRVAAKIKIRAIRP